jgi:3-oxoacyl-[acyl-carrier protein] reductase
MDLGLHNKTALVLGASRGLGAAVARALVAEGATVIAAARALEDIEAWRAALPAEQSARVVPTRVDMADLASVDALAQFALGRGVVDIVVNNGGGPPPGAASDATMANWTANFQSMAAHMFHLNGLLLPAMRARGWGRIVTIASSGVEQPIPNLALSNGIRAAVVGWSKTLASEVAGEGVTVNVVMPGRIETDRTGQLDAAAAGRTGKSVDAVKAASVATIPAGRYGKPEEFADVVCFLASDRAGYVTGSRVRVDGGFIRSI